MKVALTPHQEKFIASKMKSDGYLSPDEIVREALRVYELVEQEPPFHRFMARGKNESSPKIVRLR